MCEVGVGYDARPSSEVRDSRAWKAGAPGGRAAADTLLARPRLVGHGRPRLVTHGAQRRRIPHGHERQNG